MSQKKSFGYRLAALLLALVLLVPILAACDDDDVSQKDYDASVAELATTKASLSQTKTDLEKVKGNLTTAQASLAELATAKASLSQAKTDLEKVKGDLTTAQASVAELATTKASLSQVNTELEKVKGNLTTAQASLAGSQARVTGLVDLFWSTVSSYYTGSVKRSPLSVPTTIENVPSTSVSKAYRGRGGTPAPPDGYVEEEYFISGTALGEAYKTTMLVDKPKDPAKFSGLVIVEAVHMSSAFPLWGLRQVWGGGGHAWIGVTNRAWELDTIVKPSNPERYKTLQLSKDGTPQNPLELLEGGLQSLLADEIMTQVGLLLKNNLNNGPLQGMTVKYLIMGGVSLTADDLVAYIQNYDQRAHIADGKPIWDGYLPIDATSFFNLKPVWARDSAILIVNTEGDYTSAMTRNYVPLELMYIRPDSDLPNDRYREFQIVGPGHVGTRGASALNEGDQLSQFPREEMVRAMAQMLIDWVMKGTPPPKAEPIQLVGGQFVRDEFGNAKGGVRSPYVDLPTYTYIAAAPYTEVVPWKPNSQPARRSIYGIQIPIPSDKLKIMYPSWDKDYLAKFNQQIDKMVTERWLLPNDAAKLKADEASRTPYVATWPPPWAPPAPTPTPAAGKKISIDSTWAEVMANPSARAVIVGIVGEEKVKSAPASYGSETIRRIAGIGDILKSEMLLDIVAKFTALN